jgi:hypothetical protein
VSGDRCFRLFLLPDRYAVCRLDPHRPVPEWTNGPGVVSITRTGDELSIVCPEDRVPAGVRAEMGWRGLALEGPIPFTMTGVLAALSRVLADAGISVFAISTFDTDYLLVPSTRLDAATEALTGAGHAVVPG